MYTIKYLTSYSGVLVEVLVVAYLVRTVIDQKNQKPEDSVPP
jgi:hypothetical protein